MTLTLDAVRARLEELRAVGARAHDAPAFDFAATLLAKAESLGGAAGERLLRRAVARTEQLAQELGIVRARAAACLEHLGDARAPATLAFEAGNFGAVVRVARRESAKPLQAAAAYAEWLARLRGEAFRRGVRSPDASSRGAARSERAEVHLLARALYESSRDEAEATRIALRADADLPADAGPYNPLVVAVGALGALSTLSPSYLVALLAQLAELAPLFALPPPVARPAPAARRRRPAR